MNTRSVLIRACLVCACLVTASALIARAERTEPVAVRAPFSTFPMQIAEWKGIVQPPFEADVLRILGVDDYLTRVYVQPKRAGAGVGVYVGYWGSQQQGDTIHSPLNCLPGSGWEPISNRVIPLALDGHEPVPVNRYVVQKGLDRQLVLYWYQSHGRIVASEYWGKFYLVADSVRLHRTDAAIVRLTVPVAGEGVTGETAAEAAAVQFAQNLFPTLSRYLPQ
jgi:EpsI family protein